MKNIKSISKLSIQVILPLLGVMAGLYILVFQSVLEAKSLIYRHIEDTAQLYAEQISRDIIKINYDIIISMNTNQKLYFEMEDVTPKESKYYSIAEEIQSQLRSLKIKYDKNFSFYLWLDREEVLILDDGMIFSTSILIDQGGALFQEIYKTDNANTNYSEWKFFESEDQSYIYSRLILCVFYLNPLGTLAACVYHVKLRAFLYVLQNPCLSAGLLTDS